MPRVTWQHLLSVKRAINEPLSGFIDIDSFFMLVFGLKRYTYKLICISLKYATFQWFVSRLYMYVYVYILFNVSPHH